MDVVSHPDMARLHDTSDHPETPRRLEVLLEALGEWVEPEPATAEDVEWCHARVYIERVRTVEATTLFDLDTICTPTSYEAALLAAGGAIEATRRGGFAVVRPPGHHALPDRAMGFCLFDNVAIAASWAQAELGVERVAIVDWDVHHGNGTQAIFQGDDSVLFVSLHQWPLYPGTGGPDEQAATTLNVPLPAGCGDAEYARAFEEIVEPEVRRFQPDLVLVSAGFDAHELDPLAGMRLTEEGFRDLASRSAALGPRVAAVLEGGYNLETLPGCVRAALDGFA
jgi:acetoin utilization deacetylase AcuC-like enzyme